MGSGDGILLRASCLPRKGVVPRTPVISPADQGFREHAGQRSEGRSVRYSLAVRDACHLLLAQVGVTCVPAGEISTPIQ